MPEPGRILSIDALLNEMRGIRLERSKLNDVARNEAIDARIESIADRIFH